MNSEWALPLPAVALRYAAIADASPPAQAVTFGSGRQSPKPPERSVAFVKPIVAKGEAGAAAAIAVLSVARIARPATLENNARRRDDLRNRGDSDNAAGAEAVDIVSRSVLWQGYNDRVRVCARARRIEACCYRFCSYGVKKKCMRDLPMNGR